MSWPVKNSTSILALCESVLHCNAILTPQEFALSLRTRRVGNLGSWRPFFEFTAKFVFLFLFLFSRIFYLYKPFYTKLFRFVGKSVCSVSGTQALCIFFP